MDGSDLSRRSRVAFVGVLMLGCLVLVPGFGATQEVDARALRRQEAQREGWQRVPEILVAVGAAPGARIADVGAGDGFFTVRLARAVGRSGRVTAVDISAKALERLRRRLSDDDIANVDTVQSDSADMELGDAGLDGILIVNAYHEMERHEQTLARLYRALRPGGRLVLVEPLDPKLRLEPRDRQTPSHSLGAGLAVTEVRAAGFAVVGLQDPFVSRGSIEEWMLVAQRGGAAATGPTKPQPADVEPPPIGPELQNVGSDAELAAEDLRITLDGLKNLLARDAVLLVDIGDRESYEDAHLPGAILVPLGALPGRLESLRAAKRPIVAYCR